MNRLLLLWLALAAAVAGACGSTSTSTSVGPSPVRCGVSVTATPSTFPATGGSGRLSVAAARECAWSVSTQAGWIALGSTREGQGDGQVTYTVAPNTVGQTRRGALVVGPQTVEVMQQAAPCRFDVSPRSVELAAAADTAEVQVTATEGCGWTAVSPVAWLTILEGAQGSGSGRVRFRAEPNGTPAARSATLTIAGIGVTVRQVAEGMPPPAPPPGECGVVLQPDAADVNAGQTDGTFAVEIGMDCPWTAASDASWLTILDGTSGSGPAQVRYRAAANDGSASRSGRISVNGTIFTLTQAGADVPLCTFDLDPSSETFPSDGGSGRIDVDTQSGCPWSASTTASWITITEGSSDIGDGRVTYQVAPNTGSSSRTGTLIVAGQTFAVTQDGAPAPPEPVTVAGSIRSLDGSCPTRRFRVDGRNIRTTSDTQYDGGSCADLRNGVFVRVTGVPDDEGRIVAAEVTF